MGDWVPYETLPGSPNIVHNLDGVWWHQAKKPRRLHVCSTQTKAWTGAGSLHYVERCACGAIRFQNYGPWINRNERRQKR